MKIGYIVIGLLVFVGIIYLGTVIVGDAQSNYGLTVGSNTFAQTTFVKINETINVTKTITDNFNTQQISSTDAISSLFIGGFSTIKIVYSSLGIIDQIIINFGAMYGFDPQIINLSLLVISMFVIFAAISAIFRWGLI